MGWLLKLLIPNNRNRDWRDTQQRQYALEKSSPEGSEEKTITKDLTVVSLFARKLSRPLDALTCLKYAGLGCGFDL